MTLYLKSYSMTRRSLTHVLTCCDPPRLSADRHPGREMADDVISLAQRGPQLPVPALPVGGASIHEGPAAVHTPEDPHSLQLQHGAPQHLYRHRGTGGHFSEGPGAQREPGGTPSGCLRLCAFASVRSWLCNDFVSVNMAAALRQLGQSQQHSVGECAWN